MRRMMTFSNTRQSRAVRQTGRYDAASKGSLPGFKSGITTEYVQRVGRTPVSSDSFTMFRANSKAEAESRENGGLASSEA
jgi:hypothetical protein